jgi:hypothetical protein
MMMLWIGEIIGSPGSMPAAARIGISVSPNASNASGGSQTSKTCSPFSPSNAAWVAAPGGRALAGVLELSDDVVVLVGAHALDSEVDADGHIVARFRSLEGTAANYLPVSSSGAPSCSNRPVSWGKPVTPAILSPRRAKIMTP